MKEETKITILTIVGCLMLITMILFVIGALSKVKVEGGCKVNNISFNVNETEGIKHIEHLNISRGEIDCYFKGDVPLWIVAVFGR